MSRVFFRLLCFSVIVVFCLVAADCGSNCKNGMCVEGIGCYSCGNAEVGQPCVPVPYPTLDVPPGVSSVPPPTPVPCDAEQGKTMCNRAANLCCTSSEKCKGNTCVPQIPCGENFCDPDKEKCCPGTFMSCAPIEAECCEDGQYCSDGKKCCGTSFCVDEITSMCCGGKYCRLKSNDFKQENSCRRLNETTFKCGIYKICGIGCEPRDEVVCCNYGFDEGVACLSYLGTRNCQMTDIIGDNH